MDRKFIKKMEGAAYNIAFNILRQTPGAGNDFAGSLYNYSEAPKWTVQGTRSNPELKFHFGRGDIVFSNFHPTRIYEGEAKAPVRLSEQVSDVNSITVTNGGTEPIERTYSISNTVASSRKTAMEHAVGVSISATFGVSGTDINGGTTALTTVETSYSFTHSSENESSRSNTKDDEMSVVIPPKTRTSVTYKSSKSKFRQKICFDCDMDFSITIHNFEDWKFTFDNLDHFYNFIHGTSSSKHWLSKYFKNNPSDYRLDPNSLRYDLDLEIQFDDATTGDVIVKEEKL